jgi:hypothetical protein
VPTPDLGTGGQVPGTGGGTLQAPASGTPTLPRLPEVTVPTLPNGSSGPLINLPPAGPLGVCLPTVVNC